MDNVCLCEAPRIKAKFRRTWECTICGKPEQPSTAKAARPAPATAAEAALAKAVASERADIDDALRACEDGAQRSELPGYANIALLREALAKIRAMRDRAATPDTESRE